MIQKYHLKQYALISFLIGTLFISGCKDETTNSAFGFSAIIVEDFDKSLNWYTDVLNFEVVSSNEIPERGLKQANLRYEHMKLEIIALESSVHPDSLIPGDERPGLIQGLFKTGFSIPDFDDRVSDWEGRGILSSNQVVQDPVTNKQMIILRDPDGNRIQIFEN